MCSSDFFLVILAVLFPPLPVWVKRGICSADSFINIALCMLGFLPGLIHAWYIISVTPDPSYDEVVDQERGTTYIVVAGGDQGYGRQQGQPTYGTVNNTVDSQFPGSRKGFVQPPAASAQAQAGSSNEAAPPPYREAVGDNKVQRS